MPDTPENTVTTLGSDARASGATQDPSPATSGELHFEGTVKSSTIRGSGSTNVTVVDRDPRFLLEVHVDLVEPNGPGLLRVGETRKFGIHSPSRMFPSGVPTGQRVRFSIQWESVGSSTRFSALRPIL